MPTFDVVSESDMQEVRNAVDQANREIGTRFDFKGVTASFELGDNEIRMQAEQEFQLQQMMDILRQKLVKRGVDLSALEVDDPVTTLNAARQRVGLKQGIDSDTAKRMVKSLKATFSSGEQAFFNYNEDFTTATITFVNSDGTAEVFEDVPVSSNSDSSNNSKSSKQIGDLYGSEDTSEDTNSNSVEYGKEAISTAASIAGCMLAPYGNTVLSRNLGLLSCSVFLMKWFTSTEEAKDKEGETPNASPNTLNTITDGVSKVLNDAGCAEEIAEIVLNRRGIPISCTDRLLGTSYGEDGVENLAKWADELANSDFNKPSITVLIDGNNINLGDTDFGEVQVGAELSKKVELTNNSPYDIINLSSFLSSNSTDFILDVANTSSSLKPFESTSFFITFRPQSFGNEQLNNHNQHRRCWFFRIDSIRRRNWIP